MKYKLLHVMQIKKRLSTVRLFVVDELSLTEMFT